MHAVCTIPIQLLGGGFMDNEQNARRKQGLWDRLGGFLEKAGHKISEAGAPGIGQKIHDLGDKLEKTHRNPSHPHKV
jgi:hypothetical protein